MTLPFATIILGLFLLVMIISIFVQKPTPFVIGFTASVSWLVIGFGIFGTGEPSPTFPQTVVDVPIVSVTETPTHEFILFLENGQEERITQLKYTPLKTAKTLKVITGIKNMYGGLFPDEIDLDESLKSVTNVTAEKP